MSDDLNPMTPTAEESTPEVPAADPMTPTPEAPAADPMAPAPEAPAEGETPAA